MQTTHFPYLSLSHCPRLEAKPFHWGFLGHFEGRGICGFVFCYLVLVVFDSEVILVFVLSFFFFFFLFFFLLINLVD